MQQAYEILGDEDRRRDYDLELKAKKLKEELAKRGGTASANTSAHSRYVNVNIRTAEPPPGWSPSKHSTSKSSPYKPYSKEFSQSWESEIPSRSRAYHDDERRARRTASYEKPKREDSRERRRREEEREREKRRDREQEETRKEIKRQQKLTKEREAAARERERERERERKERKAREEREAAKLKDANKKMRERERERERDARRKQELEEKARAKSKPYLEHWGNSEDDDDVRRSRAKKSSSPKKQSDSPSRETQTTKQRDRSNPRESAQGEDLKYRETMAFAASYMQKIRNKASKTSSRHNTAEVPSYSAAYPDPNEKWTPKRRSSGDGKYAKDEPVIVDVPDPDKVQPEVVSPSANTQQAPPRLHKSHTVPAGYMPQTQTTAAAPPPRIPLNRAFTMQPEHEYNRPVEKHRSARRRMSFDEDDDYYQPPIQTTYHVSSRDRGIPRIIDAKYKDAYGTGPGVTFQKVKTAPAYGTEHVATSRRYGEDDVMTSDYSHMQPSYDYRTAAVR